MFGRGIGRRELWTVRDGKGEARPLKKATKVTDLCHGRDAGRESAKNSRFGLCQRPAKFLKGLPAECGRDQQPVGTKCVAALNELTDRVVGPVKRHGVND